MGNKHTSFMVIGVAIIASIYFLYWLAAVGIGNALTTTYVVDQEMRRDVFVKCVEALPKGGEPDKMSVRACASAAEDIATSKVITPAQEQIDNVW